MVASANVRLVAAVALFVAAACAPARVAAAEPVYAPEVKGIDDTCNAYRPRAKPEDVLRLARVGGLDAPWSVGQPGAIARIEESPSFVEGDFVTIVLDHGAIVVADLAHVDGPSGRVLLHAWCFIGGRLSRATVEEAATYDRSTGYRRSRYYGDDLDMPLEETMVEMNATGKAFAPPSKDVDALLVVEPDPRPKDLPFYDAFERARAHALPALK